MKSGNLRKLYVIYWRHPEQDWENARTTELIRELTYDEKIRMPLRYDTDYRLMNCHRRTESYVANRDIIEYYRRHKVRREILIFMELWQPNEQRVKEEYYSIDSDYRLKLVLNRIKHHLETEL